MPQLHNSSAKMPKIMMMIHLHLHILLMIMTRITHMDDALYRKNDFIGTPLPNHPPTPIGMSKYRYRRASQVTVTVLRQCRKRRKKLLPVKSRERKFNLKAVRLKSWKVEGCRLS